MVECSWAPFSLTSNWQLSTSHKVLFQQQQTATFNKLRPTKEQLSVQSSAEKQNNEQTIIRQQSRSLTIDRLNVDDVHESIWHCVKEKYCKHSVETYHKGQESVFVWNKLTLTSHKNIGLLTWLHLNPLVLNSTLLLQVVLIRQISPQNIFPLTHNDVSAMQIVFGCCWSFEISTPKIFTAYTI